MFGEEFALTADDQSLTEVLRQHFKRAKREIIINEPVKRLDLPGIVDLMLSRGVPSNRRRTRPPRYRLKAPTVKVGAEEITQIKSYAFAVADNERFRGVPARWTFWLVTNDLDKFAAKDVRQADKPEGLVWES